MLNIFFLVLKHLLWNSLCITLFQIPIKFFNWQNIQSISNRRLFRHSKSIYQHWLQLFECCSCVMDISSPFSFLFSFFTSGGFIFFKFGSHKVNPQFFWLVFFLGQNIWWFAIVPLRQHANYTAILKTLLRNLDPSYLVCTCLVYYLLLLGL